MNFFGKKVLFLGAQPDDIELGCGAVLHHIVKTTDVLCVTLSDNQKNPDLKILAEPVAKVELAAAIKKNNSTLLIDIDRALEELKRIVRFEHQRVAGQGL